MAECEVKDLNPIPQPLPHPTGTQSSSDREGGKKYSRAELNREGWSVRHSGRASGRVWEVRRFNADLGRDVRVACCLSEADAWAFALAHQQTHDRLIRDFLDRHGTR